MEAVVSATLTLLFATFGVEIVEGKAISEGVRPFNKQQWVEKFRYGAGRGDDVKTPMTAILPDSPFIQLRNSLDNGASPISVNGSKTNPKSVTLRQGESAVLQCEVLGMPSPVAYWTKGGRILAAGQLVRSSSDIRQPTNVVEMLANSGRPTLEHAVTVAKLKLSSVTSTDAGLYECNGDNGVENVLAYTKVIVEPSDDSAAEPSESQLDEDAEVGSSVAPNIYMYTEMRLEYPGNDAQLICRANGQPRPTVRWYNSDKTPIKNGENFTVLENGDLLVKNINFGVREPFRQFNCQAVNSLGKDTAIIDLLAISRAK